MNRSAWLLALFLAAGTAWGQLLPSEVKGVEDSLLVGGMKLSDLKYDRLVFKDMPLMPMIRTSLEDPIASANEQLQLHQIAARETHADVILAEALRAGFGEEGTGTVNVVPRPTAKDVPAPLRPVVLDLCLAIGSCDKEIRGALSQITPDEERALIEGLPQYAVEEPSVKFDFVQRPGYDAARLNAILAKCDLARIRRASVSLVSTVEECVGKLKALNFQLGHTITTRVNNLPIVISGQEDDLHDEVDSRLLIDLGGHNRYVGRHGAGVGYASVLIDLEGNATFNVRDLSVGAGLLGVGVAHLGPASAHLQGRSLCFGAGLAGVGVFVKEGGNDTYRATSLAEGFGMQGVGILLDSGGDDSYRVGLYGQGCGRTNGFGWLVDQAGNDHYWAGGLVLNSPLFTTAHYSFAQGSGSGYREDTGGLPGGIGFLTDAQGDDDYWAETYAQAASYWFSLGSLCDMSGNDTYSGYHYCQASAMHSTGAYLFDLGGDDAFVVRYGASQAIGHDYGTAFLLARGGSDVFAARDSNPGVGVANGLAIFIKTGGENRFNGPPGAGNPSRGSGSLGVFVSLDAKDVFASGLSAGQAVMRPMWGTALDTGPIEQAAVADAAPPEEPPKPGSRPMVSDAEMEKLYRQAVQWGVGSAADTVQKSIRTLTEIGLPAFDWMVKHHLAGADRLQIRAFEAVARPLGSPAQGILAQALSKGSDDEATLVLRIATDGGLREIGAILPSVLQNRPKVRLSAIRAAGALQCLAAAPQLERLLLDKDVMTKRAAMIALQQIPSMSSIPAVQPFLIDPDMPTRMAALGLIEGSLEQCKLIGASLINSADEAEAVAGIRLLGKEGSSDSLDSIALHLLDPRAGVRIACLQALDGRCPTLYRTNMETLLHDPVPVVRAVAKTVKMPS